MKLGHQSQVCDKTAAQTHLAFFFTLKNKEIQCVLLRFSGGNNMVCVDSLPLPRLEMGLHSPSVIIFCLG